MGNALSPEAQTPPVQPKAGTRQPVPQPTLPFCPDFPLQSWLSYSCLDLTRCGPVVTGFWQLCFLPAPPKSRGFPLDRPVLGLTGSHHPVCLSYNGSLSEAFCKKWSLLLWSSGAGFSRLTQSPCMSCAYYLATQEGS